MTKFGLFGCNVFRGFLFICFLSMLFLFSPFASADAAATDPQVESQAATSLESATAVDDGAMLDPSPFSPGQATAGPSVINDIFSGAATFSYPIEVPPGRLGVAPKLALSYKSYMKNGWVGVGFSLDGIGAIQRSTKYAVDYNGIDFIFSLNGSVTELVPRSDWGANYYGARIEGEFTKYYFDTTNNKWIVTTKDGTRYYYGTTPASRQFDPADSSKVFKWCLNKVQDTNGNFFRVFYTKNQGEIYLDKIEYTGNGDLEPSNYVQFYLEDRTDASPMNTTKFTVTTAKRLKAIEVRAKDSAGVYQMVRAYKLTYDADPLTAGSQYSYSTTAHF